VLVLTRRIAASALIFVLTAGGFGLCAGWKATPEARMACCKSGAACPMHKSDHRDGATHVVSQTEADSCCASSEQDEAAPSTSAFVPLVALGLVISPISVFAPPTDAPLDSWRALVPLPGSQVPKHLFLSVFLI
jgi:hypothetical protein